jgi:predicted ATPase
MKILELAYEDKATGWKLNPVQFSDLNLLVGVSGVGKTKILKAILNIKSIARGFRYQGVKWFIRFLTTGNIEYQWEGEFDLVHNELQNTEESENVFVKFKIAPEPEESDFPNITYESLSNNKQESPLLIKREQDIITFNNQPVIVKLSQKQSLISLFNGEKEVQPLNKEFSLIKISQAALFEDSAFDNTYEEYENTGSNFKGFNRNSAVFKKASFEDYKNRYRDLNVSTVLSMIQNEKNSVKGKLALSSYFTPDVFKELQIRFIEIFPSIEKIEIVRLNLQSDFDNSNEFIFDIRLKEKNNQQPIYQSGISSGMLKALLHLSEIYFSPPGSVILIDEFENSLGVNCLDSITEDLTDSDHQLQFIITSHHPYVINNIRPSHWKIVTRQGGEVTVKSAEDFHISPSRQKAYIDLINVLEDDYQETEI